MCLKVNGSQQVKDDFSGKKGESFIPELDSGICVVETSSTSPSVCDGEGLDVNDELVDKFASACKNKHSRGVS